MYDLIIINFCTQTELKSSTKNPIKIVLKKKKSTTIVHKKPYYNLKIGSNVEAFWEGN